MRGDQTSRKQSRKRGRERGRGGGRGGDFVIPVEGRLLITNNITAARGGGGATLGMIGCPFPYSYVHIIYWIVQVMFAVYTYMCLCACIFCMCMCVCIFGEMFLGVIEFCFCDVRWRLCLISCL